MYMNFKKYLSDMLGQPVALYIHPRATDRFLAGVVTDLSRGYRCYDCVESLDKW